MANKEWPSDAHLFVSTHVVRIVVFPNAPTSLDELSLETTVLRALLGMACATQPLRATTQIFVSGVGTRTVPLGLHRDGGPCNRHDSLLDFSWNRRVASGHTDGTRFVITIIRKSQMTSGTLNSLCTVHAWSFNVSRTGLQHVVDVCGRESLASHTTHHTTNSIKKYVDLVGSDKKESFLIFGRVPLPRNSRE